MLSNGLLFHQPENSLFNYSYNAHTYHNVRFSYHFHRNFELIYVMSGNVECTINGKTDILCENEFGICLSNEIHAYRSVGESLCWVGVFSGDFVHSFEKMTAGKSGEHFKFQCRPEIIDFFKAMLLTADTPDTLILKSCLYAVCSEYLRQVILKELSAKGDILALTIAEYISTHFQEKLDLSALASVTGYDYCYISRYFQKMFRMSFTDYLNSYRLEHALVLLTETDKAVTEIAYESGFQSIRNFNHVFRNSVGMTPAQYRKEKM